MYRSLSVDIRTVITKERILRTFVMLCAALVANILMPKTEIGVGRRLSLMPYIPGIMRLCYTTLLRRGDNTVLPNVMPPDRGRASQACTACRKQKTRYYELPAKRGGCLRCERLRQPCSLDVPTARSPGGSKSHDDDVGEFYGYR